MGEKLSNELTDKEREMYEYIVKWACGHFFRPLCLYSFYNLED